MLEWEDAFGAIAAVAVEEKASKQSESHPVLTISAAAVDVTGTDDEDNVEWEEVKQADQHEKEPCRSDKMSPVAMESKSDNDSDGLLDASNPEFTDEDEEPQHDNDEMYLSLKSELEDAKAEEDLEELRGEALKSALATASNLT